MGMGDELMVTGEVRELYTRSRMPIMVVDKRNRPRWNEVFLGNPKIVTDGRHIHQRLLNSSGNRPYIAEESKTRWRWRKYKPLPGEMFLTEAEVAFALPFAGKVLIEPNIKGTSGNNKAWLWDRWQGVVDESGLDFVQVGPATAAKLQRVQFVITPTFRHACAVLAVSRAFVGSEGGLHHAAAAFNVPAVVLFGGFISPDVTGYKTHRNLFTGGVACGMRTPCQHCRDAMAKITVDEVVGNLKEIVA